MCNIFYDNVAFKTRNRMNTFKMLCHVFIGILFYTVLICKESFGAAETKLVDQLNAALSFPAWTRITKVAAKYQFPVNGNESFTGKDVFVSKNLFIDDENSVINTLVSEDNEGVKHYMVTHLLGCVYANAMLKFMDLVRAILEEGNRARRNYRSLKKQNQKKKKSDDAVEKSPADESLKGCEEKNTIIADISLYKTSWTIFNFAVLQLLNNSAMFDRMSSTMMYLIKITPPGESFDEYIWEMLDTHVVPCLNYFKNVSKNINLVLPKINEEIEVNYNIENVCMLSYKLTRFLLGQAKWSLRPFLNDHCTVSEEASPSSQILIDLFREEYKRKPEYTDIALQYGLRIEQLALEVCNNNHSELGFEYNDRDKTTSFPRPLLQITDSIDEMEISQNIVN